MATQEYSLEINLQTLPMNDGHWAEYSTANVTSPNENELELEARSILIWLKGFEAIPLWPLKIACIIAYSSGAVANSLLLAYLVYYKRYKSPVFFIILSLGVADFGLCVGALLWSVVVNPIILGAPWMCKASQLLLHVSYLSSGYHVVVFAILRFFQLVYPLATRAKLTISLLIKICLTIWVADLIHAIGMGVFWRPVKVQYNYDTDIYVCWFFGNPQIANLWVITVWAIAPFLTTAGFQAAKHAMVLLRKSDSIVMTSTSADQDQQGQRQTDSRAVALVIMVYLLTILPSCIQYFRLAVFLVTYTPTEMFLMTVFEQVAYCNSAINPWIYLFAAGSVRADIRNMFTRSRTRK